jgi:hypothetical protein
MGSAQHADGIVLVLRAFLDESGTHGGSTVLTVGAAWAQPSVWKKWTKDWNVSKRPVKIHHSSDCHNFDGEYKGWSPSQRDAYVKRILPVIAAHKINGRVAGLHLRAFEQELARHPKVAAAFGRPYIACFQWAINDICDVALSNQIHRVAFIHETNDYEDEAKAAFNHVKARFPEMLLSITFASKCDFVPLQCADVFAFEGNRRLRNLGAERRKPLEIIDPDWDRIGYIEYDERNMPEFVSTMAFVPDPKPQR